MAMLEVRVFPQERWNRLELYHDGTYIGDYEQSADKNVDLKCEEAEGAADIILDAYRRHGGKIVVRWHSAAKQKEIRTYQENQADPGRGGTVLGLIPREYWTRRR